MAAPIHHAEIARLLKDARAIDRRLSGKPRQYRIGCEPRISWFEVAAMMLCAAAIGAMLAIGGAL